MSCKQWKELWITHLYGELEPEVAERVEEHLAGCASCRDRFHALRRTRALLQEAAPDVPSSAPLLVLTPRRVPSPAWAFATGAVLTLVVAVAGFAVGRGGFSEPRRSVMTPPAAAGTDAPGPDEVEQRLARERIRFERLLQEQRREILATARARPAGPVVTRDDLRAELDRWEKRQDTKRSAELQYVLQQVWGLQARTERDLDRTQQALRYIAVANNPQLRAQ